MRVLREFALDNNTAISPSSSTNITMTKATNNYYTWKSPIPYLFGSLALMLLLISVALILLVLSYRKNSNSQDQTRDNDDGDRSSKSIRAVDFEPDVLVIMAGDERPSCLATPALTIAMPTSTNICSRGLGDDQTC